MYKSIIMYKYMLCMYNIQNKYMYILPDLIYNYISLLLREKLRSSCPSSGGFRADHIATVPLGTVVRVPAYGWVLLPWGPSYGWVPLSHGWEPLSWVPSYAWVPLSHGTVFWANSRCNGTFLRLGTKVCYGYRLTGGIFVVVIVWLGLLSWNRFMVGNRCMLPSPGWVPLSWYRFMAVRLSWYRLTVVYGPVARCC